MTQNGISTITCGPPIWLESLKAEKDFTTASAIFELQTVRDTQMECPLGVARLIAPWPIVGDNPRIRDNWFVPVARFPLYEYCSNYACRSLYLRDAGEGKSLACDRCGSRTRRGKWPTIQVPVVMVCASGHLSDFPWGQWLHQIEGPACSGPNDSLRYLPGSLPDRPRVECRTCGRSRILNPREEKFTCMGGRPWLPGHPPEICHQEAQIMERTSTAIYYPNVISSITVPPPGVDNPPLMHQLRANSAIRSQRRTYALDKSESNINEIVHICAQLGVNTDADQVKRHLAELEIERHEAEDRPRELDALLAGRLRPTKSYGLPDLIAEPQRIYDYQSDLITRIFQAVSLVPRLREVRVLTGFSRVRPADTPTTVNYEQLWGGPIPEPVPGDSRVGWLPAYEVFGEGILFQFRDDTVAEWERDIYEMVAARPMGRTRDLRGFLVHTLAHAIMRAAAPYSGYPLPSLRERIYDTDKRLAFLVYTSDGDLQGTLGGLVDLGRPGRLESLMEDAIDRIRWCTTDPVCIEDGINLGRADTTLPGACHHCLLVPETSCERANRKLDRASLIGIGGKGGLVGV